MDQDGTQDSAREAWLLDLVERLRPCYEGELPEVVTISPVWVSARPKQVGACWWWALGGTGRPEIFIHPGQTDSLAVAGIVAHELIHACRPYAKHGPAFRQRAHALGLEGRMPAAIAGSRFKALVDPILDALGPYPHGDPTTLPDSPSSRPKQTTRLLKAECPGCGYTDRRKARKRSDVTHPPCPVCGRFLTVQEEAESDVFLIAGDELRPGEVVADDPGSNLVLCPIWEHIPGSEPFLVGYRSEDGTLLESMYNLWP